MNLTFCCLKKKPAGPLCSLVFCLNITKCLRACLSDVSSHLEIQKSCGMGNVYIVKSSAMHTQSFSFGRLMGGQQQSQDRRNHVAIPALKSCPVLPASRLGSRNPGKQYGALCLSSAQPQLAVSHLQTPRAAAPLAPVPALPIAALATSALKMASHPPCPALQLRWVSDRLT